jgi:hypothetical protein
VGASPLGRPLVIVDSTFERALRGTGLKWVASYIYFIQKIFFVYINIQKSQPTTTQLLVGLDKRRFQKTDDSA